MITSASKSVSQAVESRRSIRAFQDRPVDLETIRRVMDTARWAPSGCNYQPWEAAIVTGKPLAELRARIAASPMEQLEYDWTAPGQEKGYQDRLYELSAHMFSSLGIARDDKEGRASVMERNKASFDAPAVLLCYFPRMMKEPQWSDVGMWLQTIMLLLREEGLDSCPQEYLAFYGKLIKDFLGVDAERNMFFCGVAIGYRDDDAAVNNFERFRVDLDRQVRFIGFDAAE